MSSTAQPTQTIEIFCSYSHKDQRFRDQLETHLSGLKREGYVSIWHDRKIGAGEEWADQIDAHLNTAQIILPLISADFVASDYCYDIEMKQALARHEAGEARVIPIILRSVDWKNAPFGKLKALPKDGKAITSWSNRDAAYLDVAQAIRKEVKELSNNSEVLPQAKSSIDDAHKRTLEQWLDIGQIYFDQEDFERALAAYEQAIRLDPDNAFAYYRKGHALRRLDRLYEALPAHEQAIRLDPNNSEFYYH
jgi:tetratricopeptide (TPR) repeat protein